MMTQFLMVEHPDFDPVERQKTKAESTVQISDKLSQ
jgi:hypothetical protein